MNFLNTSDLKLFGIASPDLVCWIAAVIILLIIEANTATLTTIWFALGAAVAAVLAALKVSVEWQTVAFIASSVLFLILTKPLIKRFRKDKSNTNKDILIGSLSYVTEDIDNSAQTGYIKINGVYWSARSTDNSLIPSGSLVEVKAIQGNKLIVCTSENKKTI